MLILLCETDVIFALFYSSMTEANPTDELEETLWQMTLPYPSLPNKGPLHFNEVLYYYPYVIKYLKNSVRSLSMNSTYNFAHI